MSYLGDTLSNKCKEEKNSHNSKWLTLISSCKFGAHWIPTLLVNSSTYQETQTSVKEHQDKDIPTYIVSSSHKDIHPHMFCNTYTLWHARMGHAASNTITIVFCNFLIKLFSTMHVRFLIFICFALIILHIVIANLLILCI